MEPYEVRALLGRPRAPNPLVFPALLVGCVVVLPVSTFGLPHAAHHCRLRGVDAGSPAVGVAYGVAVAIGLPLVPLLLTLPPRMFTGRIRIRTRVRRLLPRERRKAYLKSVIVENVGKLKSGKLVSGLDPSMLSGFVCRDEAEWVDLRRRVGKLPRTIFGIQDQPPTWPGADDDNMGLESVSDPEDVEDVVDDGNLLSTSHTVSTSSHGISRRGVGLLPYPQVDTEEDAVAPTTWHMRQMRAVLPAFRNVVARCRQSGGGGTVENADQAPGAPVAGLGTECLNNIVLALACCGPADVAGVCAVRDAMWAAPSVVARKQGSGRSGGMQAEVGLELDNAYSSHVSAGSTSGYDGGGGGGGDRPAFPPYFSSSASWALFSKAADAQLAVGMPPPGPHAVPAPLLRTPRTRCTTSPAVGDRWRCFGMSLTLSSRSAMSGAGYKRRPSGA
ncbi:hypothetical protein B0H11DRAFT_2250221 [Mycena galericulata]|nr:hypothetical protein B0H11DRAFT_2250221 [Mycena galericulata]